MLTPFINLLLNVLTLYEWVIIIYIVMGWLVYFNILNQSQTLVWKINYVLARLTEPVLKHIRRYMPDLGGIDISPIILFLLIFFLKDLLVQVAISAGY